jgi:hypothetical protein
MDIDRVIEQLRAERKRLDGIIETLERLGKDGQIPPAPKRRGRRFMTEKARQEVSTRMKRYWERRKAQAEKDRQHSSDSMRAVA